MSFSGEVPKGIAEIWEFRRGNFLFLLINLISNNAS